MMDQKRRATRHFLATALAFLSLAIASCAGMPSAIPPLTDAELLRALPERGLLYAKARPRELPLLLGQALSSLTESERKEADRLVKSTREAWIALERRPTDGKGASPLSVILSGDFPAARLRMGLSAAKGVTEHGGWFLLPNGLSVAILSGKRVIATTGDMEAFLDRVRAAGAEVKPDHPIEALRARAEERPETPLIALSPDPLSALFSEGASDFIDLPMEALWMEGRESSDALETELSFDFGAQAQARVFTPAVRIMAGVLRLSLGTQTGSWETAREGKSVVTRGIKLDEAGISALIARLAPKGN